jgi:hypothetical protein
MANLVQVEATALLAASLKVTGATYTPPTVPLNLRLMWAGTSTATSAGTEVPNGGGSTYAAQSLSAALGTASAGSITTTLAITYTNMPATTTIGVEVWDSAGPAVRKWFGALTVPKATALGDTLSFAVGSITATLG